MSDDRPTVLESWLGVIARAHSEIDRLAHVIVALDDDDLARAHHRLTRLIRDLQKVESAINGVHTARFKRGSERIIDGLPRIEKRAGSRTYTFDDDGLSARVVAVALDERIIDRETGEVMESEAQAVMRVVRDVARLEWRVTDLARHGIHARDEGFRTATYGPDRVRFLEAAD